jgi:Ni,Fe-hydrogenase III component G
MTRPADYRVDAVMNPDQLLPAVQALVNAHWGYLTAITALDHPVAVEQGGPAENGNLEALYQFASGAAIATLRISLPYSKPVVPSVCGIIPSATLYEREMIELFGVVVEGTPSTDRLVLPDDWPDGIYPLRKAFTGFKEPQVKE